MPEIDPATAFLQHVSRSLLDDTFIRLKLSAPHNPGEPVSRLVARLIELDGTPHLSIVLKEARRDITKNIPAAETGDWLAAQLPHYRSAVLESTVRQWQLTINRKGKSRLIAHKPSVTEAPSRSHDREKSSALDESARPWLEALGLVDATGRVRGSMFDKHRQLERYLELFTHWVAECGWTPGRPVTLADMGCGKGYLTFGVWHLLNRVLKIDAHVTGIEARPELVERTNQIARSVGAATLQFQPGEIHTAGLPPLDALIALHACNTATDDALVRGITSRTPLIIVSPCCHQEVRPQLKTADPLAAILSHGILAERFSEWLTDGLRALHLQAAGYRTRVVEFIDAGHTPRNLLLVGIRGDSVVDSGHAREQILKLKQQFNVTHQRLDSLL